MELADDDNANAAPGAAVRGGDLVDANAVSDAQSWPARRELFAKLAALTRITPARPRRRTTGHVADGWVGSAPPGPGSAARARPCVLPCTVVATPAPKLAPHR